MNYLEITVKSESLTSEVIIAFLSQLEFESFEEEANTVKAFIQDHKFNAEAFQQLKSEIQNLGNAEFVMDSIPEKNWNEEWEKNYFKPIVIGNDVIVRGSFHKDYPEKKYEIIIDPKMAFGTGHHATTSMILEYLLEMEVVDKQILDMGAGTGILAILCDKLNAQKVLAVDIDTWAVDNAKENFKLNDTSVCSAISRDEMTIKENNFDVVLANINRNVLLTDISYYKKILFRYGVLIVSGFLKEDLNLITDKCVENNLSFIDHKEKDGWIAARYSAN